MDNRAKVREAMAVWRKHPKLAEVREPKELAKLPEEERRAWQQLWSDVATLLKKVEP
jgi:hypothetical protein